MAWKICRFSPAWSFIVLAGLLASAGARAESDVLRGKYLATIGICAGCHTPEDAKGDKLPGMTFAGGRKTGGILSPNLTSDPETGLGAWSEDQIVAALRDGRRPDGSQIRTPMGVFFYRNLSDNDARAIAAYLKTLPPVKNKVERLPKEGGPMSPAVASVPEPDKSDKLAYGRYIGETVSHCFQCHTPRGKDGLPDLTRAGMGGNTYSARGGGTVASADITPANTSGMASWTDEQIKVAITEGLRPDGGQLSAVMEFDMYAQMSPDDLDALVAYLRTVAPANH